MTKQCSIIDYYSKRIVITLLLSLFFTSGGLFAQTSLDTYIEEGLTNNEGIKQNKIRLQKNINALKEAKALFFPALSVGGSYLHADGGRMIELAIGDMLNPVYSTLNELTGSQKFQDVENMSVQMNPENFYDARIRLSMPIYNAEIFYNHKINKSMLSMQEIEALIYKRELIKEIKTAYYMYCQAYKSISIRENGIALAKENFRINQSLYDNDKVNYTSVLRSKNEVTKAEEALFTAQRIVNDCQSYFNFLLNKPFDSQIAIEEKTYLPIMFSTSDNVEQREELKKMGIATEIYHLNKSVAQSYLMPKVGAFVDFGSQAENWKFNNKSRYYMLGVSLEWTFSLGGGNSYKVKQAKADIALIESESSQIKKQLELQLLNTQNAYDESLNSYKSAQSQQAAAKRYYEDIAKAYREGQALYIELLEAQNQFIDTELQLNISLYNVYIRQAEKERADASFDLSKF